MYENNMTGYFGHSNDSLFASADEMAGNYTPHNNNHESAPTRDTPTHHGFVPTRETPPTQHGFAPTSNTATQHGFVPTRGTPTHHGFIPTRDIPTQPGFTPPRNNPTQTPASRGSNGHHPIHSIDIEDMELNYPMPDDIEIWRQAEHPDSVNKLLNITGDMCQETFRGAAQMLSHANPETFEMPLESRFICMKVDRDSDMRYCLTNGAVTNLPGCNDRINAVWRERDGQRVFMMFSISGAKEFCAMAEMLGPVQSGSMPGWSKAGCEGIVLITFIYVKNVPFNLINHIKHKSNRQPVANMWNSMLYHDNTGYHVARIYCEHPVLSSVLVKIHTETQVGYKSQLRIPTSGNTVHSASSFSSQNKKPDDPHSATRPYIHRSGNRAPNSNASWWRSNENPPTPSRQPGPFFNAGTYATPTPVVPHQYGMNQKNMTEGAQSPPPFTLPNSGSSGFNDARSFTTADDRMIAEFANSRDAKRSQANQTIPSGFQHVEAATQDPFCGDSTSHNGQTRVSSAVNAERHGQSNDVHLDRSQAGYNAQWQGHDRVATAPVYCDDSAAGLGNTLGAAGPYNHPSHQPSYTTNAMPPQLPTPVASSHASQLASTQANKIRRQQSQGFALQSPPSYNTMQSLRGHGHPAPQPNDRAVQITSNNPLHSRQQQLLRPGSPIKQRQSMPTMIDHITEGLHDQHLGAPNTDANADNQATVAGSHDIHAWIKGTPNRDTLALTKQSSGTDLAVKTSINPTEVPKPPHSADKDGQLIWYESMAADLDAEVEMAKADGRPASKIQTLALQQYKARANRLKVEIAAAQKECEDASGDLAKSTVNHPPTSSSTPHNSGNWPKGAVNSEVESDFIAPVEGDGGKILRSVSKTRERKPTYVGQKLRHRRGNVEGFSPSFYERMNARVEDIIRSPTRVSAYANNRPARTHGHPQQRTAMHPAYEQYDSCAEDQQCNEDGQFYHGYSHNDHAFDFASQAGVTEDEAELFSPRGRGYQHMQPGRDASHMSYNGGAGLWYGPQQK